MYTYPAPSFCTSNLSFCLRFSSFNLWQTFEFLMNEINKVFLSLSVRTCCSWMLLTKDRRAFFTVRLGVMPLSRTADHCLWLVQLFECLSTLLTTLESVSLRQIHPHSFQLPDQNSVMTSKSLLCELGGEGGGMSWWVAATTVLGKDMTSLHFSPSFQRFLKIKSWQKA